MGESISDLLEVDDVFERNGRFISVNGWKEWFCHYYERKWEKHIIYSYWTNCTKHHLKLHIYKVTGVVVTGYISLDNNIEKGGRGIKVSHERARRIKEATKKSYKRVYRSNETYLYWAITKNIKMSDAKNTSMTWKWQVQIEGDY